MKTNSPIRTVRPGQSFRLNAGPLSGQLVTVTEVSHPRMGVLVSGILVEVTFTINDDPNNCERFESFIEGLNEAEAALVTEEGR